MALPSRGHDRLIVDIEIAGRERATELALDEPLLLEFGLHSGRETDHHAAAPTPGRAQGEIGPANQPVGLRPVPRRDRQPDTGGDLQRLADPDRTRDRRSRRLDGGERRLRIGRRHQSANLWLLRSRPITTSGGIAWRSRSATSEQHLVAAGLADRVLGVAESVDIENGQRQAFVGRARGGGPLEAFEKFVAVGQAGDRLDLQVLADLLLAGREPPIQTAQLPERGDQEADEAERDQDRKRRDPVHGRGRGTLRAPVQPADDAAIAIEQGLYLAIAVGQTVVEPQAFEPGGLLQDSHEPRVVAGKIGGDRLQRLDRPAQCLPMPVLDTVIGLPRHHETQAQAGDRDRNQDDRERDHDAQDGELPARRRAGRERIPDGEWICGPRRRQPSIRPGHRRH